MVAGKSQTEPLNGEECPGEDDQSQDQGARRRGGKLAEGNEDNVLTRMRKGEVSLVINTPSGAISRKDEVRIRSEAIARGIALVTTEPGARATVAAIAHVRNNGWDVAALQDYLAG